MKSHRDLSTYAEQWKIWKRLSAPVWKSTEQVTVPTGKKDEDGNPITKTRTPRAGKIDALAFRNAYKEHNISLLTKGTPNKKPNEEGYKEITDLSVGRINAHLTTLKNHIINLGRANGHSEEVLNEWSKNVKLCSVKEPIAQIDGLDLDINAGFFTDY